MSAERPAPQRTKTEEHIGEEIKKMFPIAKKPTKANPEKVRPVTPTVRNRAIDSIRRRIDDRSIR
jgi:hypothetical protein